MDIKIACEELIAETLKGTKLSPNEQRVIKAELQSHFAEQDHHLQLEGYPAKERKKIMKSEFGDPKEIGKHFFMAHRKFDRIPLIGPLFYYAPVRWGVILLFLEVIRLFGACFLSDSLGLNSEISNWNFTLITGSSYFIFFIPMFIGIGIFEGIYLRKIKLTFGECINTIVVAITPFILLFLFSNYSAFFLPSRLNDVGQVVPIFGEWMLLICIPIILGYSVRISIKKESR